MQITRRFTQQGADPFAQFEYDSHDCVITNYKTKETVFELRGAVVPRSWSKNARDTLISKYFRKGGVPLETVRHADYGHLPDWLCPRVAAPGSQVGGEVSVQQVISRIVGHWTFAGYTNHYFDPSQEQLTGVVSGNAVEEIRLCNARAYFDEMVFILLSQMGAPNSPQWFNSGLWWAYGLTGSAQGHWVVDLPSNTREMDSSIFVPLLGIKDWMSEMDKFARHSLSAYQNPQVHACFILDVKDTLLGTDGILPWIEREARIFKYGSGSGVNPSKLRSKHEKLSGGGKSSGLMSWLESADRSAGAIKSGGTTRRAAKMVTVDLDHPDVHEFVFCKTEAEIAVASMVIGSRLIKKHCQSVMDAIGGSDKVLLSLDDAQELAEKPIAEAKAVGVLDNYIIKAIHLAIQGEKQWPDVVFDEDFNGRAYAIAPFQNANHSVRIPSDFYAAVDAGADWQFVARTDKSTRSFPSRDLETEIAKNGWFCGDPGVQYDTTCNDWNVTPHDGRIDASNPCSEHMRLNGSACNLASQRLMAFYKGGKFDVEAFLHSTHLWQFTLDLSNSLASLPDRTTAINVYNYRDTGLGYADLGAFLMAHCLPYDSDGALSLAGIVSSLMQAQCHVTSAKLAESLGAYPRFHANKQDHLRCVLNHRRAFEGQRSKDAYEGLTVAPMPIDHESLKAALGHDQWLDLFVINRKLWEAAIDGGNRWGYRNAEMTVIAPTGTIGITLDCDTTGVEPLYGLKVFKQLVGGGGMDFTPQCLRIALRKLEYFGHDIEEIVRFVNEHGCVPTAQNPTADGVYITEEHVPVFATAASQDPHNPAIAWAAHIRMMAAVQSFISGAISKTVNMPADATIEEVRQAYRMGHDLGTKAIALYRDGCKLSQPLNLKAKPKKPDAAEILKTAADNPAARKAFAESRAAAITQTIAHSDVRSGQAKQIIGAIAGDDDLVRRGEELEALGRNAIKVISPPQVGTRVKLGWNRRPGIDISTEVGNGKLYLRTVRYDDGRVAEIWATYSADQGTLQAMLDMVCKTANVALQGGIPITWIVKSWMDSKFEPNGLTASHPYVKTYTSIMNLIAKLLAYHELGDESVLNVKPPIAGDHGIPPTYKFPGTAPETTSPSGVSLEKCPECAGSMIPNGTCKKCVNCGFGGGCGA
jgi:ribonucleoside-diphosphate reductase alpha chain